MIHKWPEMFKLLIALFCFVCSVLLFRMPDKHLHATYIIIGMYIADSNADSISYSVIKFLGSLLLHRWVLVIKHTIYCSLMKIACVLRHKISYLRLLL